MQNASVIFDILTFFVKLSISINLLTITSSHYPVSVEESQMGQTKIGQARNCIRQTALIYLLQIAFESNSQRFPKIAC